MATRWSKSRTISEFYEEVPQDLHEAVAFLANVTHHLSYNGSPYGAFAIIVGAIDRVNVNV